jgi:hypothetical protein
VSGKTLLFARERPFGGSFLQGFGYSQEEDLNMRRFLAVLTLAAVAVGLGGCGPKGAAELVRGKGKVLYKGKGVADATLVFTPDGTGVPAGGTTDKDGNFTLVTQGRPGAGKGNYKVTVLKAPAASEAQKQMKPEDMMRMAKAAQAKGVQGYVGLEAPKSEIPTKYNNATTSGLTATVSGDASRNEFEFTLAD